MLVAVSAPISAEGSAAAWVEFNAPTWVELSAFTCPMVRPGMAAVPIARI